MVSTNDESGSSSSKTVGKRGVTRLQTIHKAKSNGKRIEVQWNARGQPIKHNSKSFASYIGVTVRRLVPISLDSWSAKKNKEAIGVYKQNIWDEIEKAFVIGEEHRAFIYKEAGKLHRAFRTKMAKSYLRDSNGGFVKHRPAKYSYCIKQEDWDKFVAQRMTEKFQGLFSVNIYLSSPSRCLVARGKLYNTKGNTVHGMTLPPGYVKVNIEVAIVPNAPLPISVDGGDVSMVCHAIGTIVPWPMKLLEFVAECEKNPDQSQNKAKNTQRSVDSVSSPNKSNKKSKIEESPRVGGSTGLVNLPFLDMYVKKMMRVGSLVQIKMEESIFGEEFLEHLRVENIKEILDHNWLSASTIIVFARYLYDKFISPNGLINKFSFISPHVSREDNIGNAVAKILLKDEEYFKDKMILAPCNLGKHWVLLVINLDAEVIYYMDPLNGEPTKHQNLKTKFENALQIYRANSGSKVPKVSKSKKISWSKIRCPRQINSIDCGYFVMRFMKEVIMENEIMIPVNYFDDHKCRTYSNDKLTEVKEDWATYMVDDVFGKQEAIILPS